MRKEGESQVSVVALGFCFIAASSIPAVCINIRIADRRDRAWLPLVYGRRRVVVKSDNEPTKRAAAGRVR